MSERRECVLCDKAATGKLFCDEHNAEFIGDGKVVEKGPGGSIRRETMALAALQSMLSNTATIMGAAKYAAQLQPECTPEKNEELMRKIIAEGAVAMADALIRELYGE